MNHKKTSESEESECTTYKRSMWTKTFSVTTMSLLAKLSRNIKHYPWNISSDILPIKPHHSILRRIKFNFKIRITRKKLQSKMLRVGFFSELFSSFEERNHALIEQITANCTWRPVCKWQRGDLGSSLNGVWKRTILYSPKKRGRRLCTD